MYAKKNHTSSKLYLLLRSAHHTAHVGFGNPKVEHSWARERSLPTIDPRKKGEKTRTQSSQRRLPTQMDPEAEEKYWLVATPTTKQNGSPVYYRSPSSGKYHAIIHSVIPPTLHVLCEQWHEDEDTGEYEKYTVVEEVTVTTKELDA